MVISRLCFYTLPGKTQEAEKELQALKKCVLKLGSLNTRVLRTHFASPGAPDLVFEEEAQDIAGLDALMAKVINGPDFKDWTSKMSGLLTQSPKRELYEDVADQ